MHFRGRYIMSRRTWFILVAIFLVLAVVIIISNIAYLIHKDAVAGNQIIVKNEKIISIPPPPPVPSAEVIAQRLHCTQFKNIAVGGGVQGIVLDEGSCKIGNVKYAIDTFQTQAGRDMWLKMAEPYGVVPKWETSHSVTYKSVTS
jgi:hypothetical protein